MLEVFYKLFDLETELNPHHESESNPHLVIEDFSDFHEKCVSQGIYIHEKLLFFSRTTLIKSKNSKTKSKEFLISDACPATKFTVAVSPPLMDLLLPLRRLVAKNGQKMDPLFG